MAQQLLVPVDGSPLSKRALEHALEEYEDASVIALHILDPTDPGYSSPTDVDVRNEPPHGSDEWYERASEEEEKIFDDARELASEHGGTLDTDTAIGEPAREIVDYAEENEIDHVVMGSHGRRGETRLLLGSVADMVVRRSPVSVTVIRD
ncbi:UspA domain-containing protein [Haloterrigena salina JCM 13891]|uniref:UspA domain-containing protein n=1 Tax=Haloterrigena salina JCM 13891 TaxID=1227488 RepID=M0CMN0_9EURY|nr:universal stress protein [Haloterrigena salina]ELZ24491.1 UspA domain-containing protein [Haloterrigena salina JCM 13891]